MTTVKSSEPIAQFDAILYKVQTIAAGGFRVTLDGTSQDIAQAAFLMPFADAPGVEVKVTFERVRQGEKVRNGTADAQDNEYGL